MRLQLHPDPTAFLTTAGAFLREAPLVNQMQLGIAAALQVDPGRYGDVVRMVSVHDDADRVVGAVMHTPPWLPGVSAMPLDVATFAGAAYARVAPDVNGAFGEELTGLAFAAAAWGARTPSPGALGVDQRMGLFGLTEVAEVPRASGEARPATLEDTALLQEWLEAFHAEAVPTDPPVAANAGEAAAKRGLGWMWTDGGRPVAYASFGRIVEGWISVGPVYTPPELRGRGYATSLVADMSRRALAEGRVGCTLFTDLANPTSNAIYERMGYRRVGTMARYRFR